MADFSFLSDTDDSAVEEILAEAADHVALKQISALNLSSVSDSVLPNHLESRFRRLKTFPSIHSAPNSTHLDSISPSQIPPTHTPASILASPEAKSRSRSFRRRRSRSPSPSSSSSSTSWLEEADKKGIGSVSPPLKKTGSGFGSGCLWWSPKKVLRKLSFGKRSGGGNGAVLESIGKEQKRILKRAAKEEMKINLEAEKIVNRAKHVSTRMESFRITDDASDDDELNHYNK